MGNNNFSYLICPEDKTLLTQNNSYLICLKKHKYPIINDIPVIILPDKAPTLWVAKKSWELANKFVENKESVNPCFIETLGLSLEQKNKLNLISNEKSEPEFLKALIEYMLPPTSGTMFKNIKLDLNNIPIPEIPCTKNTGLFLDVGCNWGRWSIAATKKGFSVVGLDPSLGSLVIAKKLCKYLGIDATFVCADSRYMPFTSEMYDVVYSYSVLQHFSDEDTCSAVQEISRVLKNDGLSLIQMANKFGLVSLYHQCKRCFRKPINFEVRYRSPQELKNIFNTNIGSSTIKIDCFFGLGIQYHNILSPMKKIIALLSQLLKVIGHYIPFFSIFADSLFVYSIKSKKN